MVHILSSSSRSSRSPLLDSGDSTIVVEAVTTSDKPEAFASVCPKCGHVSVFV